jgi:hypothetical protein
MATEATIC